MLAFGTMPKRCEWAPVDQPVYLAYHDAEWGVPARESIRRWIARTLETDDAVSLVPEIEGGVAGYLLASVSGHPAMSGISGELEELYVRPGADRDQAMRDLVQAGVAWARARDAGVIVATVGLDAPWTADELAFWTSLGFEHDTAQVKRYFHDGC